MTLSENLDALSCKHCNVNLDLELEKIKYLSETILIMINDISMYINADNDELKKDTKEEKVKVKSNESLFNSIPIHQESRCFIGIVELSTYIEKLSKGLLTIFNKKHCTIITLFDKNLTEKKINLDEMILKQIIFNIVSNAIKNTDAGKIIIKFIEGEDEEDFRKLPNTPSSLERSNKEKEKEKENVKIMRNKRFRKSKVSINQYGIINTENSVRLKKETPEAKIINANDSFNKKQSSFSSSDTSEFEFEAVTLQKQENEEIISKKTNSFKLNTKRYTQDNISNKIDYQSDVSKKSKNNVLSFSKPYDNKEHKTTLTIKIEDNGPGIDKDLQRQINNKSSLLDFTKCLQLNKNSYEDRKGLGIGLIIIKRLTKLLNIRLICANKYKKLNTDQSLRLVHRNSSNIKNIKRESVGKKSLTTSNSPKSISGSVFILSFTAPLKQIASSELDICQSSKSTIKQSETNILNLKLEQSILNLFPIANSIIEDNNETKNIATQSQDINNIMSNNELINKNEFKLELHQNDDTQSFGSKDLNLINRPGFSPLLRGNRRNTLKSPIKFGFNSKIYLSPEPKKSILASENLTNNSILKSGNGNSTKFFIKRTGHDNLSPFSPNKINSANSNNMRLVNTHAYNQPKIKSAPNLIYAQNNILDQIDELIKICSPSRHATLKAIKTDFIYQALLLPKTKKIILIEDNEPILKAERNLINAYIDKKKLRHKYSTLCFNDGIEALYAIYRDITCGENSIKLIISDEMMNYMNGTELHSILGKKLCANKSIPFIICSAFSNEGHFDKLIGMKIESLKKPLSKGNVEYLFSKYLGIK